MKHFDTVSLTNLDLLSQNLKDYLGHVIPIDEVNSYLYLHPEVIELYFSEFEIAIHSFNQFRILSKFPHKNYYKNAQRLNKVFKRDLPKLKTIFQKLSSDPVLTNTIFSSIANDKYFQEVWVIRPVEYLLINLFLLIYRTTVLELNKDILINSSGHRKVQISSTIEEMVFYNYLLGDKLAIHNAFSIWLDKWSDEGFDQSLFVAVASTKNVI